MVRHSSKQGWGVENLVLRSSVRTIMAYSPKQGLTSGLMVRHWIQWCEPTGHLVFTTSLWGVQNNFI